jgi:hypothetical protein
MRENGMTKTLFFYQNNEIGMCFGTSPKGKASYNEYYALDRRISLKTELQWRETVQLQNILRFADIWEDFPAIGLTLIDAEFKGGDEDQRIDLLYLRNDGGILPCELKIGGDAKDSHGQLIRYMADLRFQTLDMAFLKDRHQHFLGYLTDQVAKDIHIQKFNEFLSANVISDKFIRLLPRSGILIDEGFPSQLLKAVRYLNNEAGFAIRLLKIVPYVAATWKPDETEFIMRLDFYDVQ